jgi:DNA-binding Xre family transcriptional regulator
MDVLIKICSALGVRFEDIMELVPASSEGRKKIDE